MADNGLSGLYDPTGAVDVEQIPLSARPTSEKGLRLGVLSNTKWNAAKLLRATVAALEARGVQFASVDYYDKEHFSSDASPEVIARIAAECDVALTAIGDCGSCPVRSRGKAGLDTAGALVGTNHSDLSPK